MKKITSTVLEGEKDTCWFYPPYTNEDPEEAGGLVLATSLPVFPLILVNLSDSLCVISDVYEHYGFTDTWFQVFYLSE